MDELEQVRHRAGQHARWWAEATCILAIVVMLVGAFLARGSAQSPEVLNERIMAERHLGELQDARIISVELAIIRIEDRIFYLLIGVASNLFALALMIGSNYLAKRKAS